MSLSTPQPLLLRGASAIERECMNSITFKWNKYAACWECVLTDETVYIHKYPPAHTLVSIQKNEYINLHEVFDSLHAAHTYIGLRYNGDVRYRDPNEENHPRRDLLDLYI